MTRKRVDDYQMNSVDETEALDSTAMVQKSPSNHGSDGSFHSGLGGTKHRRKTLADEEEDEEPGEAVKDLLVYYARNSTMHGIPSIVGSKLYRGRHIFWMGIVCMMALFLGTVVYWQMSDYYDYPTVTSVDIHYVTEEDFPAVTICDPNVFHGAIVELSQASNFTIFQLAKLTEIAGLYHNYAKDFLDKEKNPPQKGTTDTIAETEKLLTIAKLLMSSASSNPLYCSWGNYYWTQCPAAKTRITEMGVCSTVDVRKLMNHTNEAMNKSQSESQASRTVGNFMRGLTFYLDTVPSSAPYRIFKNQGFKVVLHDPSQEPLPLSNGINIQGNANVEVEVTKKVKEGLPAPYKAFGAANCLDTTSSDFVNPLQRFDNYSKEVCEQECFMDYVVDFCGGCKYFLHPGNESICPLEHLAECYREAQRLYFGGQSEHKQCHCPLPCTQVNFQASVTQMAFLETDYFRELKRRAKNTNEHIVSYVHIYYSDPVVTTMRQVAIYSTEGLLGNIGGQIGLFMGFSLVTVAEMLELVFLLATRGRKLDEQVKQHKDAEAAAAQLAVRNI